MFTIYHNPKCSKSRESLKLLEENASDIKIVEYLKTPLSIDELKSIALKLNLKPAEFVRTKESLIQEEGLDLSSDDKVLAAMVKYPKIIERPIIIKGDKAVLGRPPENIKKLL
jgi:arsenate reductase